MIKFAILSALILGATAQATTRKFVPTAERVTKHGYPLEEHNVQTGDGYILTLYRIPYSPTLQNQKVVDKKSVFLLHGLLSSSDSWILNGAEKALAFILSDAGYDVWMGNARGNVYSRKHVSKSPSKPSFWDFDWHQIGIYDLPAMIDYILYWTGQDSLHYIGHSQGTTAFIVLMAEIPSYNEKIKSSHLLAPVVYMSNAKSIFLKSLSKFLGRPSLLASLLGNTEFFPSNKLMHMLGPEICNKHSRFLRICNNVLFLIAGWNSTHLDDSLIDDIMETHPAGSSTGQPIHYMQGHKSDKFRQYEYGIIKNKKIYHSRSPPHYQIQNIKPKKPIHCYYSDNDDFAAVKDVHRLGKMLGDNVQLDRIIYPDFNHLDYLWAIDAKDILYDCIKDRLNMYENFQFNGTSCKHFRK